MSFQEEEIAIGRALLYALRKHKIDFIEGPQQSGIPEDFARVYCSRSAILSETPYGSLNFYNPAAERIFGYSHEEVIGRPSLVLVPEDLQPGREILFRRILESQEPEDVITKRITKSGDIISISGRVFTYEWKPGELSIAALVMKE